MKDRDEIKMLLVKVMSIIDELFDELDKFRKEFKAKELTPKKFAEMTEESASDNIYGSVKSETGKAYLILHADEDRQAWIPKSAVNSMSEDGRITLHGWFKDKVQWKEVE